MSFLKIITLCWYGILLVVTGFLAAEYRYFCQQNQYIEQKKDDYAAYILALQKLILKHQNSEHLEATHLDVQHLNAKNLDIMHQDVSYQDIKYRDPVHHDPEHLEKGHYDTSKKKNVRRVC